MGAAAAVVAAGHHIVVAAAAAAVLFHRPAAVGCIGCIDYMAAAVAGCSLGLEGRKDEEGVEATLCCTWDRVVVEMT